MGELVFGLGQLPRREEKAAQPHVALDAQTPVIDGFSELHGRVFALGRDLAIDRHREVLPGHAEEGEQPLDRRPGLQIHRLSVHRHTRQTRARFATCVV